MWGGCVREREELRMTSGSYQGCRRKTGVIMAKEVRELVNSVRFQRKTE